MQLRKASLCLDVNERQTRTIPPEQAKQREQKYKDKIESLSLSQVRRRWNLLIRQQWNLGSNGKEIMCLIIF